jgi:hypothetical protein
MWVFALLALGLVLVASRSQAMFSTTACPQCSTEFMPAFRQSGTRLPSSISLIVLHDTEGDKMGHLPTAKAVAEYFKSPTAGGSTQLIVDETSCYRSLPDTTIPWGAAGGDANVRGVHIEMVGLASWSRQQWLTRVNTLRCAAYHVAEWMKQYSIPLEILNADDLRARRHGITTHRTVTEAFHVVGGHTDPGSNFPMDVFVHLVQQFLSNRVA